NSAPHPPHRHDQRRGNHLQLVGTPASAEAPSVAGAVTAWSAGRPPLLRVCAGEALLLAESDVDLVTLVNQAAQIGPWLLDDTADPDDHRLAEVLLEYLCHRYGVQRRGKGDRIINLESIYRRHLLPFLVELDTMRPPQHRGVAHLRLRHLESLPAVLAGDAPLPAATVAGDLLNRRGIACVYLDLADAGRVADGGPAALETALASGVVPVRTDARTGQDIVLTADLRTAGLLVEPDTPHGIAASTAGNVLRDL